MAKAEIKINIPKTFTVIESIEQIFFEKLNAKTGWGKNEVMSLFQKSVSEAVLKYFDKTESK